MDPEELQAKLQEELVKATTDGAGGAGFLSGFSPWTLFLGFAFGVLGWWILKNGRKKQNLGLGGIGIALMVYPYFIYNPWFILLVGASLCLWAYKIWD